MPRSPASPSPGPDPITAVAALYRRYAVALLAVTLVIGVWMRAMLVWPRLASPIPFQHLVHAHSHVGFFGWLVLGLAGAIIPRAMVGDRVVALRRIAHALAVASVAALFAFAWQGYGAASIGISAVHVVLWILLARQLWPLAGVDQRARPWLRLSLVGLCAAGASTIVPGILRARGVETGWLRELGIELFLDLFIFGWVIAATVGLAHDLVRPPRGSRAARVLFAVGVLPSAFLYVTAPPGEAFVWIGRLGAGLLGTALLLAASDLLGRRGAALDALTALASVALLLVGGLQLVAAAGLGSSLLHGRPIVLAFVHLALVGAATPMLLATAPEPRRVGHAGGVALFAGGLALMLLMLVAMGWPWLAMRASALGVDVMRQLTLACVGGGCAAVGALVLALAPPAHSRAVAISLVAAEASLR